MKRLDIGHETTLPKETIYDAIGISQLQIDHLASAVRVESEHGNVQYAGKHWINFDERKILSEALASAKAWLTHWQSHPGISFVITSGAISGRQLLYQHQDKWLPLAPYLFTGYGNGKTTLAEALFYGCGVFVLSEGETGNELRIYPAGKIASAREWLSHFTSADFRLGEFLTSDQGLPRAIVIDDVGREGSLPFIRSGEQRTELQARYYDLINFCYQQKISVIITSNYRPEELSIYLGGATWSRLLEMVPDGFMIDITGVRDFRPIAGGRILTEKTVPSPSLG